ncbi:MAG: 5-methyltetrahydropteroyltriglutamate--homocysteine S-methyltransferase [Pseudomonadota bacterium]|nr:5-methyltetrahydropteroyltriglutamate--homocysteine S-methyltransferase [Pseudomonadota bacterium]
MASRSSPPFRADHVGSLLRPKMINEAFKLFKAGKINREEMQSIEDKAIKEAIKLQEDVGMQAITDGEFRRASYWSTFVERVEGLEIDDAHFKFHNADGDEHKFTAPVVEGKVSRSISIAGDEFEFVKINTKKTPKTTIVSPPTMHMFRLDKSIKPGVYDSRKEYFSDLSQVYREEIKALADAGCIYIQLDDVPIPMLSDPQIQARVRADGLEPAKLMDDYINLFNDCLSDRPDGVTIAIHMCRGNYKGRFLSEGGYEIFAEKFFNELDVDAYFLEYESPRAGDFEPLKHVPKDKIVVLGLVSSKTPQLESQDGLQTRIDEASQFIDLGRLALSPQCGFASTVAGNPITVDDQKRKLELVVDVAEKIWS